VIYSVTKAVTDIFPIGNTVTTSHPSEGGFSCFTGFTAHGANDWRKPIQGKALQVIGGIFGFQIRKCW